MFVRNGTRYVCYTGGRNIGLRTIPIERLANWDSEGGNTIDLLKEKA